MAIPAEHHVLLDSLTSFTRSHITSSIRPSRLISPPREVHARMSAKLAGKDAQLGTHDRSKPRASSGRCTTPCLEINASSGYQISERRPADWDSMKRPSPNAWTRENTQNRSKKTCEPERRPSS